MLEVQRFTQAAKTRSFLRRMKVYLLITDENKFLMFDTARSQLSWLLANVSWPCVFPIAFVVRPARGSNLVNHLCSWNQANSWLVRHLRGLINAIGVNYVPEKRPNCRQTFDGARRLRRKFPSCSKGFFTVEHRWL